MNKKISKILVCCIMILLLFSNSTHLKSIALDEVQFNVTTEYQLKKAIEQANDNDIIGISDSISIEDISIIGTNEKHITLKRMNADAKIFLGTHSSYTITNITFDGNNIPSSYSFIILVKNTTFSNCIFKNGYNTWEGGILNVSDKKVYINNCIFTNNQAVYGGHIASNGSEYIEINDSILSNGSAQIGGAVYSNSNLTIENTKFYNNIASTGGADIYCIGNLNLKDSIEDLQKLYPDSELKPIAWVSDYNDDNSYLKLEFGIIEEENHEEPNQDENKQADNPSNETEENQNNDNTQNDQNNENTENNQQEPNNTNTENTENNQQNETNNNEPEPQNTSDKENKNNNSEQSDENVSTPTSNDDTNNKTVTNTSHNDENDNTSNSNTNTYKSSFVQKIIDKITETFNVQNPTTQQMTDYSSKSVTNKNESPVNQKIYISTSPTTKIADEKDNSANSNKLESINPPNQTFNFSFELKNDDSNNNNLLMIFIFIQSIMSFIIVIIQNKQNNRHHRYKNKKHTRKH